MPFRLFTLTTCVGLATAFNGVVLATAYNGAIKLDRATLAVMPRFTALSMSMAIEESASAAGTKTNLCASAETFITT